MIDVSGTTQQMPCWASGGWPSAETSTTVATPSIPTGCPSGRETPAGPAAKWPAKQYNTACHLLIPRALTFRQPMRRTIEQREPHPPHSHGHVPAEKRGGQTLSYWPCRQNTSLWHRSAMRADLLNGDGHNVAANAVCGGQHPQELRRRLVKSIHLRAM